MPVMNGGVILDSGRVLVTLNFGGNGTTAFSFNEAYSATPAVCVFLANEPDGVASVASATKTGAAITITGSQLLSRDIYAYWAAVGD